MSEPKTPRVRREEQLHIRLTAAQKAVLTEAAGRAALDVSSWLRSLGMREAAVAGITEATMAAPDAKPKKRA